MTATTTGAFADVGDLSLEAQPFQYRAVGALEISSPGPMGGPRISPKAERTVLPPKDNPDATRRNLEAEIRTREKRAHDEGIKEGQAAVRAEVDRELASVRESLALAIQQFEAEREDYYHSVENHVVNLALAIARKILHREAQIDPLLLAGAVRVALEKVSSATLIRLHVHPDQVQTWKEFLDRQTDIGQKPEILGDAATAEGQCRIESSIGTADLSLENQITEIERGFFDLLAQRPQNP